MTVSRIERDVIRRPKAEHLAAIARVLGATVEELLDEGLSPLELLQRVEARSPAGTGDKPGGEVKLADLDMIKIPVVPSQGWEDLRSRGRLNVEGEISVPLDSVGDEPHKDSLVAIRISEEVITDVGASPGDVVVICPHCAPKDQAVVFARAFKDGQWRSYLRRLQIVEGVYILQGKEGDSIAFKAGDRNLAIAGVAVLQLRDLRVARSK